MPAARVVSIHARLWRATRVAARGARQQPVSIHARLWRATSAIRLGRKSPNSFNPRSPVTSDSSNSGSRNESGFQSTLACGERPLSAIDPDGWSRFNPRSPVASDLLCPHPADGSSNFNPLHPSQRSADPSWHYRSQPHRAGRRTHCGSPRWSYGRDHPVRSHRC